MPTTKMPVWIRSEYVTIGQPPFREIRGQEAALARRANRLPLQVAPPISGREYSIISENFVNKKRGQGQIVALTSFCLLGFAEFDKHPDTVF